MLLLWVTLAALALVILWAAFTFNRLVRNRNRVDAAWALIDAELQRRYDLVPQLVGAVQGYADHERAVLERVVTARAAAVAASDLDERARSDTTLTSALQSLFAIAEAYPELMTSEQLLALQQRLVRTEDRIAYARGYFNALVVDYETRRATLPSKLVASAFRFPPRRSFEAAVESRTPVAVELRGGLEERSGLDSDGEAGRGASPTSGA